MEKLISLLLIAVLLACASCTSQKDERPNIILIACDDLGWSDIGPYGSEVATSNLDMLAENGMRFTRFHNTSKCFPSRACLLTGVYAQQNGFSKTHTNPITNAVTLGEVLRTAGYRTYWSGKHHGVENPYNRGFDSFSGLRHGACNHFNPGLQRKGEGVPAQKRIRPWILDSILIEPYTPEKGFYTTDEFTKYAINWLEEFKTNKTPFFLYLAYTAPHDPLMAWPEDIAKYNGKYDEGFEVIRQRRYEKQLELGLIDESYSLSDPTYRPWSSLSEEEKKFESSKMEVYAAMIDRVDQNIGKLLQQLEALGELDNTLILFVSDNGASAEVARPKQNNNTASIGSLERWESLGKDWANVGNTPFRYYKNYSYEGGICTPLIAWWPGKIPAKSFTEFPGHFIDIMPTLVEITGAQYPIEFNKQQIVPMQGESLLPVLRGENIDRVQPLFWEWQDGRAVYFDSWKLVAEGNNSKWELYNLNDDPSETFNLAADNPQKVAKLAAMFNEWKDSVSSQQ